MAGDRERQFRKIRLPLLDIYIGTEFLLFFVVAFFFFFFIFFVNQMLLIAEQLLTSDVMITDVLRLLFYALPTVVSFSIPFGVLLGALMAVGRFSADNEILAFLTIGIPTPRLYLPVAVLGLLLTLLSFFINDYFLPLGTVRFTNLYRERVLTNPALELEPFSVQRYRDTMIVTGDIVDNKILRPVIIDPNQSNGERAIIVAEGALFSQDEEWKDSVLSLKLDNVFSHDIKPNNPGNYEYLTSKEMIFNILLRDISTAVRELGPREMRAADVLRYLNEKVPAETAQQQKVDTEIASSVASLRGFYHATPTLIERQGATDVLNQLSDRGGELRQRKVNRLVVDNVLQIYRLELHRKFALPASCILFTLFAFPVGLLVRRGGRFVGFSIGLLFSIFYWALFIGGQTIGARQPSLPPIIAIWFANGAVGVLGGVLLVLRWRR